MKSGGIASCYAWRVAEHLINPRWLGGICGVWGCGVRICRESKQERRFQCKASFENLVLVLGGGGGIGGWCGDACFGHTPPKSDLPRSAMPVPGATGAAPRFEEGVRMACGVRGYSIRTEDGYWGCGRGSLSSIRGKRPPETMGSGGGSRDQSPVASLSLW